MQMRVLNLSKKMFFSIRSYGIIGIYCLNLKFWGVCAGGLHFLRMQNCSIAWKNRKDNFLEQLREPHCFVFFG